MNSYNQASCPGIVFNTQTHGRVEWSRHSQVTGGHDLSDSLVVLREQ